MHNTKIVHVELGKNFYGGAKQVFYLIKGLAQEKVKNVLICSKKSEISKKAGPFTYRCYELPFRGDLDFTLTLKMISILKGEKPDLVHIHSRRGADVWGGIGALLCKIPCIITRRVDNPEHPVFARLKYSLYKKIVVISLGIKKVLLKEGIDEKKIVYIPSGVEFEEYSKKCKKAWFLKEFSINVDQIPVGMIAQFIPRKGHDVLLKAALLVLKEEPKVRFLLFGKGPLEKEVKRKVKKLGLQKMVRFCGFRTDIDKILPCLFMVVHPALMEGLGVSLLQASASGVPIVASNAGGIPEVVKNGVNGFLVSPGNPEDLAQKIMLLIRQKDKAKAMGVLGKKFVKENFSVKKMVVSYLNLYRSILQQ